MAIHTKFHASEHESGGIDEIAQGSLLPQDPTAHASSHETGGTDVLNLDATQIGDGSVSNTEFQYLDGVTAAVADQDYVDSKIQGLDWQESVIDRDIADPSTLTPSDGDRYIVASGGTGDWSGQDEKIAEYDGGTASWVFTTPDEGFAVWVEDENIQYTYNGDYNTGSWVSFGSTQDHGALTGLSDDDHSIYLLVDGTRAMSGSLDMGTNNIINVGNVDGIDVSAHDHDGDAPNVPNAGLVNSSVTVAGNTVSLGSSTSVNHSDLSNIGTDDHHTGFIGLEDNAGTAVSPAADDYIQITDDGIVNADAGTNTIDLSVTESNITHDNLGGFGEDNHHEAFVGIEDQSGTTINPEETNDTIAIIGATGGPITTADDGTNGLEISFSASAVDHNTLANIGSSDHHTKTGDDEVYGLVRYQSAQPTGINEMIYADSDDNSLYIYDGGTTSWIKVGDPTSGATQLSELSDVSSVSYTAGDVLRADGAGYVTATLNHTDLANITYNDHHGVGNGIEWDGSNNIAIQTDGVGTDEIDLSISPTWTGTHDFTGAVFKPRYAAQSAEPSVASGEMMFWEDTDNGQLYISYNDGADVHHVELTGA